MKRTHITAKENRKNCTFRISAVKLSNTRFRQPSLVDEFYIETTEVKGENPLVGYQDPIYMLFNQQRLAKIGTYAVESWLESMKKAHESNSALNELRKKCSDDDLLSLIKSRHLQKPCEIMAWAQYMKNNLDEFNENLRILAAEKQAELEATKQQVENVTGETTT